MDSVLQVSWIFLSVAAMITCTIQATLVQNLYMKLEARQRITYNKQNWRQDLLRSVHSGKYNTKYHMEDIQTKDKIASECNRESVKQ